MTKKFNWTATPLVVHYPKALIDDYTTISPKERKAVINQLKPFITTDATLVTIHRFTHGSRPYDHHHSFDNVSVLLQRASGTMNISQTVAKILKMRHFSHWAGIDNTIEAPRFPIIQKGVNYGSSRRDIGKQLSRALGMTLTTKEI